MKDNISEYVSYESLGRALAGRDTVTIACPWCGPACRHRFNQRRRTMKIWAGAGKGGQLITYNCARCGEKGYLWPKSDALAIPVRSAPEHDMDAQYKRVNKLFEKVKPLSCYPSTEKYILNRGLADVLKWSLPFLGGAYFKRSDGAFGYAMVAGFCDASGVLTTLQYTTLDEDGRKQPYKGTLIRRFLPNARCPQGGYIPLAPLTGEVLGVAEGIETALSATLIHGVPTWATVGAVRLPGFKPPPNVRKLIIFGDNDPTGVKAASRLCERLSTSMDVEICIPDRVGDWNDVLMEKQNGL